MWNSKLAKQGLPLILSAILASCATAGDPQESSNPWTTFTHLAYGGAQKHYVDMTIPKDIRETMNAMVFLHGYNGGKMENWTFLDNYRKDMVVSNVNYRAISAKQNKLTMDDLLEDISNALAAIRNKAQDHGITLNKLVIVGHSLGGFLALNYGYRFFDQDPPIPIAFCVTMAGLSDLGDANWISLARNPFHWISFKTILLLASSLSGQAIPRDAITNFGFTEPVLEILKEISPRYAIREGIPPTIIVHDAADTIVPYSNATSLNGALDAMRVPNILISTSNYLNHGLSSNPLRETRVIRPSLEERMIQAIDQYLSLYGN